MCKTFVYRCAKCDKTVKSMVKLEECPYCSFRAWWDEIQIIEKDESEENKTLEWQDNVIEPNKKMTQREILEKVEQLEEDDYYIHRCLNVKVCPGCGRDLLNSETANKFFKCECGFKYTK